MLIFGYIYITKNGCIIYNTMLQYQKGEIMRCENCFCIYQENGKCVLDEINIDITGQCDSCIYVDIPKSDLENIKNTQRRNCKW